MPRARHCKPGGFARRSEAELNGSAAIIFEAADPSEPQHRLHVETFGEHVLNAEASVLEAFVAEALI
ncbi:hypothetical protein [Stenomitos frigidus]|uniref:hypothetical protein n=1 Tax=Stenomitos frigidus TaxID=1886765 RepID=UPI001C636686|nr:hypothetical protein [Stenomitos frigidus]